MVKKRDHPKIEELIERPWCYYCERDFDDARVLLSHQKAKHFRCNHCNRRLNTAGGLSVHLQQVHKETLTSVENAIEGREGVDPEIFGMCGVPEDLVNAHKQRIMNEYFKMEAERRARTGNPPPGTVTGEPKAKKAKLETPEELKARLKAHREKKAAERANPTQANAPASAAPVPGSISPATTPVSFLVSIHAPTHCITNAHSIRTTARTCLPPPTTCRYSHRSSHRLSTHRRTLAFLFSRRHTSASHHPPTGSHRLSHRSTLATGRNTCRCHPSLRLRACRSPVRRCCPQVCLRCRLRCREPPSRDRVGATPSLPWPLLQTPCRPPQDSPRVRHSRPQLSTERTWRACTLARRPLRYTASQRSL